MTTATRNGGEVGAFGYPGMSIENWDITKLFLRIGAVGTATSIPVCVWALKRWPDSPVVLAIILASISPVVKENIIPRGSEEALLAEELNQDTQRSAAGYRGTPVRAYSF